MVHFRVPPWKWRHLGRVLPPPCPTLAPSSPPGVRERSRAVESKAMKPGRWSFPTGGMLAFVALTLAAATLPAGCDPTGDGPSNDGWSITNDCAAYASCESCTPIPGCGWCFDSNGTGQCASDPDSCSTPAFSWTWNSDGCRIAADAGAVQVSTDDAGGVQVSTDDAGAVPVTDAGAPSILDAQLVQAADAGAQEDADSGISAEAASSEGAAP